MEFLKTIVGDELYKQLEEKINAYNGNEANTDKVKIGNLGTCEYVSKGKYDSELLKIQTLLDVWTYRKWASGIYECWGEYSGSVSINNHLSSAYYSNGITVNYPVTFTEPAIFTVDGGSNDKINWARKFAENRTDRATFLIIALEQQSSVQVSVNLRVCGRWKLHAKAEEFSNTRGNKTW